MTQEPKFFDAHTHMQFPAYDADRDEVLARAREAGVWMINVGTQLDTSRAAVELAERGGAGIFAAVGLHPMHTAASHHDENELGTDDAAKAFTSRGETFDFDRYREMALHPKVLAIGECGLDYFHLDFAEPREAVIAKQKEVFEAQIELALEVKKPLMIHCRDAFADLIEVLKKYEKKFDTAPGVIHFFTGTPDDARALLALGFSFTFGGAVTFPPRKNKENPTAAPVGTYDEVAKLIPADRILSETDAPYVAPNSRRGKRNEPSFIPEVIEKLAQLKELSPEVMKRQIWENAQRIFKI